MVTTETPATKMWDKPIPELDSDTEHFWEACKQHELRIQRCLSCSTFYWPPVLCNRCDNPTMEWTRVSGKGKVFSFVVFHKLYHPGFTDEVPYNVAIVELEEGPLLQTRIIGIPNDDIQVDMPVEVVFEDVAEEFTLHRFRPVGATAGAA